MNVNEMLGHHTMKVIKERKKKSITTHDEFSKDMEKKNNENLIDKIKINDNNRYA